MIALRLYTGATIVAGLAALAWASVTFPIWPTISLTQAGGPRRDPARRAVLDRDRAARRDARRAAPRPWRPDLPPAVHHRGDRARRSGRRRLGGAWSATLEARELREVPWYGTLANHAAIALVGGSRRGRLCALLDGPLGAVTDRAAGRPARRDRPCHVRPVRPVGRAGRRDGDPARRPDRPRGRAACSTRHIRNTSASEVVLGWVLVDRLRHDRLVGRAHLRDASCWSSGRRTTRARSRSHDAMTGLLSRSGFDARLEEILVGSGAAPVGPPCWRSTSMASRPSTTPMVTPPAMRSSARSVPVCVTRSD